MLVGTFQGAINFGGATLTALGTRDLFVAKLAPDGSHVWSKRFDNGTEEDFLGAALDTSGNVLLTGAFGGTVSFGGSGLTTTSNPDVFVVKLSASGNHLWSKKFGGTSYEAAESTSADAAGNVIVSGIYYGTINFGGSNLPTPTSFGNSFLVKLDPSGNHLWSKGFASSGGDVGWSSDIAVDSAGDVFMATVFHGTANLGGSSFDAGSWIGLAIGKYTSAGMHVWSKGFPDTHAGKLALDGNDLYVAAEFRNTISFGGTPALMSAGNEDAFLVKFQPNGAHTWHKHFGDPASQWSHDADTNSSGSVLMTGAFSGSVDYGAGAFTSAGADDVFAVLLTLGGEHLWSGRFGDAANQKGTAVALSEEAMMVAGIFESTVDFGVDALSSAGGPDIFVAALTP